MSKDKTPKITEAVQSVSFLVLGKCYAELPFHPFGNPLMKTKSMHLDI